MLKQRNVMLVDVAVNDTFLRILRTCVMCVMRASPTHALTRLSRIVKFVQDLYRNINNVTQKRKRNIFVKNVLINTKGRDESCTLMQI